MAATPYAELNGVLAELVAGVRAILGDNFLGAYLQGSFAVGDFDADSDCDFISVIGDELSDEQVRALNAMHERIYGIDCTWAQHLEGSYFPGALLRDYRQRDEPLWYLDHGSRTLERSTHDNTVVPWIDIIKPVMVHGDYSYLLSKREARSSPRSSTNFRRTLA